MFDLLRLMPDWMVLILVVAVMWWGITFNTRLKERYGCTACTFWGVTGGTVGTLCWMLVTGSSGSSAERLIAGAVALTVTLALFFSNRSKSGNTIQGIFMTVWQLFVGLVVFVILGMLNNGKKKEKK